MQKDIFIFLGMGTSQLFLLYWYFNKCIDLWILNIPGILKFHIYVEEKYYPNTEEEKKNETWQMDLLR